MEYSTRREYIKRNGVTLSGGRLLAGQPPVPKSNGQSIAMMDSKLKVGSSGQIATGHLSALYGYATMLTLDRAKAEELVQETYLRAVRAFDRLTPNSNLKGWLFTIMRNAWFNDLRHGRTGPGLVNLEGGDLPASDFSDASGSNPHVIFIRKITRDEVRAAIESLPVHYREVVVLRDLEDFSYQEIAAVIGCPVGTVMSRLGRAREKLRLLLDQWQGGARTKAKA